MGGRDQRQVCFRRLFDRRVDAYAITIDGYWHEPGPRSQQGVASGRISGVLDPDRIAGRRTALMISDRAPWKPPVTHTWSGLMVMPRLSPR